MALSKAVSIFTLCLILTSAGCSSTKQYDGPEKPSSSVSILIRHEGGWIHTIDGKWRGIGDLKRYDFLPGEHTLKVYYGPVGSFVHAADYLTLTVNLKPGRTYDLVFTADLAKKKWNAFVIDALSGEMASQQVEQNK